MQRAHVVSEGQLFIIIMVDEIIVGTNIAANETLITKFKVQ
jgi:hypothetical protein